MIFENINQNLLYTPLKILQSLSVTIRIKSKLLILDGFHHNLVLTSFCLISYHPFVCSLHHSKLTSKPFFQAGFCLSYLYTCFSHCPETTFLRSLHGNFFIRSLYKYQLFKVVFIGRHTLINHPCQCPPHPRHLTILPYIIL